MTQLRTVVLPRVYAFILWLATLAIGLFDIYIGREIFFALYARFSTARAPAIFWGDVVLIVLALVYVGFVIITSEYHLKHVGTPASWKLFYQSLVVELFIPFLAYFM